MYLQHKPARVVDISFSKPKLEDPGKELLSETPQQRDQTPATLNEQTAFFKGLDQLYPRAVVLTTVFDKKKTEVTAKTQLPPPITSLYHPKYKNIGEKDLKKECLLVFQSLKISQDQADYLARTTKLQSQCLNWFQYRQGRLTASRFKAICHTSVEKPAKSLVESILHTKPLPQVAALRWGIENEDVARQQYEHISKQQHTNLTLTQTGLHIHPSYPHLGASPDGLLSCDCCGDGLLEIKCPYSIRDSAPQAAGPTFYLKSTDCGLQLSHSHAYYYQIQGQLSICNRSYCDFVCWTPVGIHIERILKDDSMFETMRCKLDRFFIDIILPKIMIGESDKENVHPDNDFDKYCYCRKEIGGEMIGCDNHMCPYEWFHLSCVSLKKAPEGEWFCPDCTMLRSN